MATTTTSSSSYDAIANTKLKSIKEVALSPNLTTIPTNYVYFADPNESSAVDPQFHDDQIPIIDFSLLASGSPDKRSKIVQDLTNACQHWGFFMVVNHGVSESLMKAMIDQCNQFFNLTVEEKQEFEGKHVLDPIRCGTSFNTSAEKVNFWRDYLKVMVHPQFHSPTKPHDFSEISSEYCKQIRHVVRVLLRGISASLGLDEMEIERSMNLERSQQILIANLYPPCPQPNLAIGMPAHSDHGLLTLLTQNDVGGLQILHEGKWVSANPLPNSFLVNTGDHIEVVNHGVPESLMKAMIEKCDEFFNLTAEEKQEFEGKHVLDPIRCGTSFNPSAEKVNFWRDYLKVMVHPHFHSPTKPHDFSEISSEYCKQVRRVTRVLLRGISTSLGLDDLEIERSMNLEGGQQILAANLYPPCPQPNLAIGMPPHSDHGLLTLLIQNHLGGLQILHDGKWVQVNPLPNAFLVNIGDHLEIFSNGKYKSILHRAIVNNRATRISIAMANGPSLDTVVSPAPQLVNSEENVPAKYKPMVYREYMQLQQSNKLVFKFA